MGFFSDIRDKIFNRHHDEPVTPVAPTTTTSSAQPTVVAQAAPASTASPGTAAAPQAIAPSAPAASTAPASAEPVDVAKILDQAAKDSGQTLNWRTSIVDLMKAVGIDSSLTSRKELAKELDYTGDTDDSATMNIWLQKQVLAKLAANGGNVPADLLD